MKISFRTSLLVVAFNVLLALVLAAILSDKNDWTGFLFVPIVVIIIAAVLAVVSLFIIVIVQKQHLEPKIYFFGQLAGTIAIIGFPAYMAGYHSTWDSKYGNIEANRSFAGRDSAEHPETMIAFRQLEAKFADKNDLALQSIYTHQEDTAIKSVIVFFIYNTSWSRKQYLTSKHVIGPFENKMIYFNVPYLKNKELLERQGQFR